MKIVVPQRNPKSLVQNLMMDEANTLPDPMQTYIEVDFFSTLEVCFQPPGYSFNLQKVPPFLSESFSTLGLSKQMFHLLWFLMASFCRWNVFFAFLKRWNKRHCRLKVRGRKINLEKGGKKKEKEGGKGTEEGGKRDCVVSSMTSSYYQLLVYLLPVHLYAFNM